jgi:acetylornithine deacetylase
VLGPRPERPSLLATVKGTGGGRSLMLNGHLDTKPVGAARELWRTDPLVPTIVDGDLFGLGSNDMKAGVAAMSFAAAALVSTGTTLAGDLVLGFVADEEAGATEGSKYLAPLIEGVDAILIGEPSGWTEDWQGIHLVSRGVACFRITVRGTQTHSSLSDRLPSVNASVKMAGLLRDMRDEIDFEVVPHPLGQVGPTLNPGVIVAGGTNFGVVPGVAWYACDLRTVPGMTQEAVARSIEAWLDRRRALDPELSVTLEFDELIPWLPPSEIDAAHPLVTAVQAASADVLGSAPPLSVFPGGTDAPWFAAYGIPTLASFGPGMLTSAHGPNEFVSVRSILEAARIYARVAMEFC